jgi:hypothetical protein
VQPQIRLERRMRPAGRLKRNCNIQNKVLVTILGLSRKTMIHKALCSFLHEERGFRYAIANEALGDAIVDLLSECFSCEPMRAALRLSTCHLAPLVARFIPECTSNGLSVIAMPVDHSDTLAGAFICRDFSHRCRRVSGEISPGSVRSGRR